MTPPGGDVSGEIVSRWELLENQEKKWEERYRQEHTDMRAWGGGCECVCLCFKHFFLRGVHTHHEVREHKA